MNTSEELPRNPEDASARESAVLDGTADGGEEQSSPPGRSGLIPVLLIDDDPAVSRVIQTCLSRNGYSVTMAASGVDGIREIMENDFAVILCDMLMPALSGDMFYRAVERIRPSFCSRIIFITGHRGDGKTKEFLKSVNGQVLLKPFHPSDLLDAVGFAAVCGFFSDSPAFSVEPPVEPPQAEVARAPGPSRPASRLTPGELKQSPFWKIDRPGAEAALESLEKKVVRNADALKYGLLGGALLALAAVPAGYYFDLKKKEEATSAQRLTLLEQWDTLSRKRPDLTKAWGELQALQNVQKRLVENQARPRWMPALQTIAMATPPEIQLKSVNAGAVAEAENYYRIRIEATCVADQPRAVADTFRENLEAKMSSLGAESVSAQFDRMEEVTDPFGQPDPRRISFDLVINTAPFAPEPMETRGQP